VEDLARCMLLLIRDQHLRERLVAHAMEYAKENNWAVKKQQYLALVDGLRGGTQTEESFAAA